MPEYTLLSFPMQEPVFDSDPYADALIDEILVFVMFCWHEASDPICCEPGYCNSNCPVSL